ncbi:magnesium-translocating P-type ATPase [Natrinema caseinilyticum]|uniref:magnesium-translocating P-type ATPase n=1 Tax=Natrinema caseinilyticum TaxID=2961570 RepID=UPI0020C1DA36|nr:magnesium-translocating P-type ATPase [Natrinema caseinilyticum]
MSEDTATFWSQPLEKLYGQLDATKRGLEPREAETRLSTYGYNRLRERQRATDFRLFVGQFRSPIVLILLFAAGVAFIVGDRADAAIIVSIVLISSLLGFWQERGAADAVASLFETIQLTTTVRRGGKDIDVPVEEIVPGDIVRLSAGDTVPGDCRLVESSDLNVDEAALTGEAYPIEKSPDTLPADTPLAKRSNALFMGTHVVSGQATALVVRTGRETEFGRISEHLQQRSTTEFERGIRRFGKLLSEVTLLLVLGIFAINVYFARPVLDSFLFALALAVGLTPQLLPAIISVNLASGAKAMACERVIVKRLSSIEDFGSMSVLCTDKTGTLTEGEVRVESARDITGNRSDRVRRLAYLNAAYETGFDNPIDEAVRQLDEDLTGTEKLDEVPYDFTRKRLSVLLTGDTVPADGLRSDQTRSLNNHRQATSRNTLVTKGAVENVLEVCTTAIGADGATVPLDSIREDLLAQFETYSANGFRVLGVAYRETERMDIDETGEEDMTFAGFLVLYDPPKPGVFDTLEQLDSLGVSVRIITGDNRHVAAHVAKDIGFEDVEILTGTELRKLTDEALVARIETVTVFAEIEPNQKERILRAFRHADIVVGYLGDGINDAPALHAADVGLSVDSGVDAAKEAADIVLLEKDLHVLKRGVQSGRKTFANTLKYVFMATSANFGNMFSMAVASLFLPFLPLLPTQILLMNLLTDIPELTISTDEVDHELVEQPHRWDLGFIKRFMATFGLVSSVFDFVTFGVLLIVLNASVAEFRTGWAVMSVISASIVVLVIRTRRPLFRSSPSRYLIAATIAIIVITSTLPYTPIGTVFKFTPLPPIFLAIVAMIVLSYVTAAEIVKYVFYRHLVATDASEPPDE